MYAPNSPPGDPLRLPGAWSAWEWNDTWKKESRYRRVAYNGNDYDYQYDYRDPPQTVPRSRTVVTPTSDNVFPTQEGHSQEPYSPNYTYAERAFGNTLENTTQMLARSSISGGDRTSGASGRPSSSDQNQIYHAPSQPFQKSTTSRHISTRDPSSGSELNPEYRVHHTREFRFGRVFRILWTEPKGTMGTIITGEYTKVKFGEYAYSSIRRFVIVDARREGHSICLPILTYGHRGTRKTGLHVADHAVIYTSKPPVTKSKEITKPAIRMDPDNPRHKLDSTSLINYAKLYTVEHNVKVHFIGKIAQKHEQQVVTDFNATHEPLPDRPYYGGGATDTNENVFEHAQGQDPGYSAPGTSWSTATTAPAAAPTYFAPNLYPTPTTYPTVSFAVPAQRPYPTSSAPYGPHSNYGSNLQYPNVQYSPQSTYATPAQNTQTADPYRSEPGYRQEPSSPTPSSHPPADTEEPSTEDTTPHREEDLYDEDH